MISSIFHCVCWPSVCLLWAIVDLGLMPFLDLDFCAFFLYLSCVSNLYILENKTLFVVLFTNISSKSEWCVILLTVLQQPLCIVGIFHVIQVHGGGDQTRKALLPPESPNLAWQNFSPLHLYAASLKPQSLKIILQWTLTEHLICD